MNRTFAIMIALANLSVASACCPITWDGPFEGTIVDAMTGKPIEGAVIGAFWRRRGPALVHDWTEPYAGQDAITDAEGKFRIDGLHAINWLPLSCVEEATFTIYAKGYYGCETVARDAVGDCGQPSVRLMPTSQPKPPGTHEAAGVQSSFWQFVPRMVEAIRRSKEEAGANPTPRREDSSQWHSPGSLP